MTTGPYPPYIEENPDCIELKTYLPKDVLEALDQGAKRLKTGSSVVAGSILECAVKGDFETIKKLLASMPLGELAVEPGREVAFSNVGTALQPFHAPDYPVSAPVPWKKMSWVAKVWRPKLNPPVPLVKDLTIIEDIARAKDPNLVTVTIAGCANTGRYVMAQHLSRWLRSLGYTPEVDYDGRFKGTPIDGGAMSDAAMDQIVRNGNQRVRVKITTVRLAHKKN